MPCSFRQVKQEDRLLIDWYFQMGAKLGAHAISHLEEVSEEGIAAMAASGTVATVLPTTAYILRINPPPVRKMIEHGMAIALGSDFNPNAHCVAMVSHEHVLLFCKGRTIRGGVWSI